MHLLMSECLSDKGDLSKHTEILDLCEFFKKVNIYFYITIHVTENIICIEDFAIFLGKLVY